MAKRYETGTKDQVIYRALLHAIDDRDSMVDGYRNRYYDPNGDPDNEVTNYEFAPQDVEYIESVKAELRDFNKMLEALRGKI